MKRSDKQICQDWLLIEETHKVNTIRQLAKWKQAQKWQQDRLTKQYASKDLFESIITYKERFNAALKGYNGQKNPEMSQKDIAMDFSVVKQCKICRFQEGCFK